MAKHDAQQPPADERELEELNVTVINERERTPFWRSERMVPVLLMLLAVSFALHLATWTVILGVRNVIREQSNELASQIGQAEGETFTLNVAVKRTVPIKTTVPVKKQLTIPISTTVPIDQTFNVPVQTGFGNFSVPIPIKVDVPIRTTVPVNIDDTVDVNTSIDLDMDVPVSVPVAQTSVAAYLERLRQALVDLSRRLS